MPVTNIEVYNNIFYNWKSAASYIGHTEVNAALSTFQRTSFINNYYEPGLQWMNTLEPFLFSTNTSVTHQIYVEGNVGPGRANNTVAEEEILRDGTGGKNFAVTGKPFRPSFTPPGDYTDVWDELLGIVGGGIGAYVPTRDSVDLRAMSDIIDGIGTAPVSQTDVGGWPVLAAGIALTDTDGDGIPDTYEDANSLDKNSAADANLLHTSGYTNLEVYLNSLFETTLMASGSVTNANMKISHVDGTSFIDFSGGTGLTDNIGRRVVIKERSANEIEGWIKSAGTSDTLGS